jgi:TPR repeat protein
MLRAILLTLALTLSAAPVAAGPFEDAEAAYKRGDYETVLQLIRPLAEQGDDIAQAMLGFMYDKGQGVPQDYAEALKWYRKAAEQGFDYAQHNLGIMYGKGEGVSQDYVLAHMWLNLAVAQGIDVAKNDRDALAKRMTPAQLAEAQRLAREWKPK